MLKEDQFIEERERAKIARKYRKMGYEVIERPESDRLPDFMAGTKPDIVARSDLDNVIIELKNHASLRNSNDLVSIADKISDQPGWRFELIVLNDIANDQQPNFEILLKKARVANDTGLFDMAYVYLTAVLVRLSQSIALRFGIKSKNKSDRYLFSDLGFEGIIPQDLLQESLAALSCRNNIFYASDATESISEQDVKKLISLCERLKDFALADAS